MAGRIPQSFIDDLLDRLDIVEVVDRRVSLKKTGRNYSACCPFHDEKTPSFTVSPDKQFYYCFGCGAGGNALGFLMEYERLDFPRAVETLAESVGLEVPREAAALQEPPQRKKSLYSVLERAADYFHRQLSQHPQHDRAVSYLKTRGLSGEIARDFYIGYAPPGWDNLLRELAVSPEDRRLLVEAGMLIDREEDNKCYDRFRDRIMFPIRDNRGRVIAFGGRVLGDDKPKYLNSPETPVFHKGRELYGLYESRRANRRLERLLIVEGYMDVVALAQHGIHWAAATLGTATSTDHLNQVFRQCPEVVFCFDGDDAGRKAAQRALESALPAMQDGRQARFLFLPQGEDPDSLVRQAGASEFIRLVEGATALEDFLFDSLSAELDVHSLEGRARLAKLAAPLIQRLPEGVYRELMMARLADTTGLSQQKLQDILYQQAPQQPLQQPPEPPPELAAEPLGLQVVSKPPRREPLDAPLLASTRNPTLYAIALLLHSPRSAQQVEVPEHLLRHASEDLPPHSDLLVAMLELLKKRPESTSAMLVGHWYGEPWGETLQHLLQVEQLIPEDQLEHELADTLAHLERQQRHSQLHSQVDKLLAKDYAQLSDEEKLLLKQSLHEMHEKSAR